ncbi:hypothetical protein AUJ14_04455 [Candidatus Micrarchaeota archaeon CG1_02_55_22]|nr:MAG: hypothetical protein AUJ14_04455 [Candidatus Micrarchaeota archaeon CG1_02_55_22]
MVRGDAALWILTKMAMLFFIVALSGIMLSIGGTERSALCSNEAYIISRTVAQSLNEVVNSPLEDELRVIKLQSALSSGSGSAARYKLQISILDRPNDPQFNSLLINASSDADSNCRGGITFLYPKALDSPPRVSTGGTALVAKRLFLIQANSPGEPAGARYFSSNPAPVETRLREGIILKPSTQRANEVRTRFLAIMKCSQKAIVTQGVVISRGDFFVFIQDCTAEDPDNCLSLNPPRAGTVAIQAGSSDTNQLCGFN